MSKFNSYYDYVLFLFRLILGVVFIFAGVQKISDPQIFAEAIYNYKLFPNSIIVFTSIFLPWLELLIGIFLLFGIHVKENSLFAGFLLLVFVLLISISLARGLNIDCGCFGTSGGQKVGLLKIIENLGLIVISLLLVKSKSNKFTLNE